MWFKIHKTCTMICVSSRIIETNVGVQNTKKYNEICDSAIMIEHLFGIKQNKYSDSFVSAIVIDLFGS